MHAFRVFLDREFASPYHVVDVREHLAEGEARLVRIERTRKQHRQDFRDRPRVAATRTRNFGAAGLWCRSRSASR